MSRQTGMFTFAVIVLLAALAFDVNRIGQAEDKTSSHPTTVSMAPTSSPLTFKQVDEEPGRDGAFPRLFTKDPNDMERAPKDCGTVNPMAVVVTLRTPTGCVKAAIDSLKKDSTEFDVVRVDMTGKGKFADAPVIPFKLKARYTGRFYCDFTAEKLVFKVGDVSVPIKAFARYETTNERITQFVMRFGWMAVGRLAFADGTHDVAFIDAGANFRLDNPAIPPKSGRESFSPNGGVGDMVFVDFGNGDFKDSAMFPAGAPIGIYGRLYEISTSPDLSAATLKPYAGRTGSLHIDQDQWEAMLVSTTQVLALRGDRTPMPVPPGEYSIREIRQLSAGKFGPRRHQFDMETDSWIYSDLPGPAGHGRELRIKIAAGETYELKVGSPITATVAATLSEDGILFRLIERDTSEGRIPRMLLWGKSGGADPQELAVEILDEAGKSIAKFPLIFDGSNTNTWTPPAGLKGKFTAMLHYRNDVFGELKIVQPSPFKLETDANGDIVRFDFKNAPPPQPMAASQPQPVPASKPIAQPVAATKPTPTSIPASTQPVNPQPGWLSLAKTYLAAGRPAQAEEYLRRVIDRDPKTAEGKEAAKLLAELKTKD